MSERIRSTLLGFVLGVAVTIGAIAAVLLSGPGDADMTVHLTRLPSGKTVKVTMCGLVWGVGHDASERNSRLDQFQLEFVRANPAADTAARDQEVLEAFELIRPASQSWGLDSATVLAFPGPKRRGHYDLYDFERNADGSWHFDRHDAKVHIND